MYKDYMDHGEMRWKSGNSFALGTYKVLPDDGASFDLERMKDNGFTMYQDFQRGSREDKTRWWFRDDKTYNARLEQIIKMGFTVIAPTQTI